MAEYTVTRIRIYYQNGCTVARKINLKHARTFKHARQVTAYKLKLQRKYQQAIDKEYKSKTPPIVVVEFVIRSKDYFYSEPPGSLPIIPTEYHADVNNFLQLNVKK